MSFMVRHAADMLANGYHVLPIGPGTKHPQRSHFGVWENLPEWQQFCDRQASAYEMLQWQRWTGAGIGVACGNVVGIDIDVMEPTLAHALRDLAREMLGDTPLIRIGQAPKALLVYRTDTPFAGIKRHPIEALGYGQQFVSCSIHPVTQRPYEWPEEHPANVDVASLPAVTQAGVVAFMDAAYALLPEDQRKASAARDDAPHTTSDQRGTVPAITAALAHIPAADHDDYASWMRVGMAVKGALGEAGYPLFDDWSAWSPKYESAAVKRAWKGFRPQSVGAGTVYHLAREAGWRPGPELTLNAAAAEHVGEPHPAAAFLASLTRQVATIEHAPEQKRAYRVPAHLVPTTGFLGDFVRYATATAKRPQPFLAVGAGLALLGAVAGRRYQSPSGLRTNFFGIGVADSGGGKDNARRCAKELLFAAGLDKWIGGEGLPSAPGLLTSLELHPSRLYQIDEFGKFLASMTGERAGERMVGVLTMLTKLFTNPGETLVGAEYSNQSAQGGRPRVDIHQPNACMWGTTVPGPLWGAVEGGAMTDGSLARFLVFVTDYSYPDTNATPAPLAAPSDLVETLAAIARGADHHDAGGNLADLFSSTVSMVPYTVPYTPEVEAALVALDREITSVLRSHEGEYSTAVFARQVEHTIKVALISAISRDPACPVIGMADFTWARDLVQHCTDTMLIEAEAKSADTPAEARIKVVLALLTASDAPLELATMNRKLHAMSPRERDDALQMLIESNQVERISVRADGKQRPTTCYGLVRAETAATVAG